MSSRVTTAVILAIVVLHLGAAAYLAVQRPIDGDEGYYAMATRLVAEGRTPYLDFFYPQAPLLPYVYAPVVALFGPRLLALRFLSVVGDGLLVLAWGLWLRGRGLRPWQALVALVGVAASPGVLDWNVTVKTYALASLASVLGLIALHRGLTQGRGLRWWIGGGVALGLAASVRLLYAPLAVVPALVLVVGEGRARLRQAVAWLAGVALGGLPLVIALARDPDRFWFNNLRYHQLKFSENEGLGAFGLAGRALAVLGHTLAGDPFLTIVLALAVWGAWSWRRAPAADGARRFEQIVAIGALTHLGVSLLPDPVQEQYMTATLAPLVLPLVAGGLARWPTGTRRAAPPVVLALLLAMSGVTLARPRTGVPAAPDWKWDHFRSVCRNITQLTRPGDTVLAFWPGYVFETGQRPLPGLENHFALGVAERLTTEQRHRYHVAGRAELVNAFASETPSLVVLGTWMYEVNNALDDKQTASVLDVFTAHYELVAQVGDVKLCLRRREVDHASASP